MKYKYEIELYGICGCNTLEIQYEIAVIETRCHDTCPPPACLVLTDERPLRYLAFLSAFSCAYFSSCAVSSVTGTKQRINCVSIRLLTVSE